MILRPDDLLKKGPGRWNSGDVSEAWAACFRAFREALADPSIMVAGILVGVPGAGKTTWCGDNDRDDWCLFDAVWANPKRRASMARRIRDAGKKAVAVYVRTPLSLCLERNAQRPSWRAVPEGFMRKAALQLRLCRPTRTEGWHRVSVVHGFGSE